MRVNVRLVDVATGYTVWAEPFEERRQRRVRAPEQAFRVESSQALELKLSPAERPAPTERPTTNEQAYDAYLQGLSIRTSPARAPASAL